MTHLAAAGGLPCMLVRSRLALALKLQTNRLTMRTLMLFLEVFVFPVQQMCIPRVVFIGPADY